MPKNCFCGNDRLKKVILPSTLEKIEAGAFLDCTNLVEVDFSKCEKLQTIEQNALCSCINLKKVILPDTITKIGRQAFLGCEKLAEIHLPTNLLSIEEKVLCHTKSLQNITLPQNLKEIKKSAFADSGVEKIVLPKSIKEIEENGICFERVREINFEKGSRYDVVKQEDKKMHIIKVEKISKPKEKEEQTIKESAQTNQTARAC